jgi:hypothetical protein
MRYPPVPAVCATLFAALLVSCGDNGAPPIPGPLASNAPAAAALSNDSSAAQFSATAPKPGFHKLKGKWLRPDGGYVVEIRDVDEAGRMLAAYFNPQSIHVAKAEASWDGTILKAFIELRDVNYPGSTYTLAYDPEKDQLKGIYFQAVQRQNFEVLFVRMP